MPGGSLYGPPELDLRSVFFYRDLHRHISRYWKAYLTAAEYSVLDMIFDRTIGWGKLWERISLNQFEGGVWTKTTVYSDGTNLSKRTIQRAITSLLKNRLVLAQTTKGSAAKYAINLAWKPPLNNKHYRQTLALADSSASEWQRLMQTNEDIVIALIERKGQGLFELESAYGERLPNDSAGEGERIGSPENGDFAVP